MVEGLLDALEGGIVLLKSIRIKDQIVDFEYVDLNQQAAVILKKSRENLIGSTLLKEFPGVKSEGGFAMFCNVVDTGETVKTANHYGEDNLDLWLKSSIKKVGDGLVLLFEDISESEFQKNLIRQSESLLAEVNNTIGLGCFIWNAEQDKILYSNEAMAKIFGHDVAEFSMEFFHEVLHEDDREMVHETLSSSLQNLTTFDCQYRICINDMIRHLWVKGTVTREDGLTNMVGLAQDISKQKETEAVLNKLQVENQVKNDQLLFAQRIAHLGNWIHDLKTNQSEWSPPVFELFGVSPDGGLLPHEVLQKYVFPEDIIKVQEKAAEGIATKKPYSQEYRVQHPSGDIKVFKTQAVPIVENGEVVRLHGICQDITEFKRIQYKLNNSNQELERFAYAASHDLQEPIRKILAFTDRLSPMLSSSLEDRGRDYFNRIKNSASRMNLMIESLLRYSRVENNELLLQQVDLEKVCKESVKDLDESVRVDIKPLPEVMGVEVHLQQVFQNLVGNGIKFNKSGSPEIHIYSDDVEVINGVEYQKIVVEDNGIGIAKEHQKKIFEMFNRLHSKQDYPGSGIGLATVKKIMERHQGAITVESVEGQGSRFILYFPKLTVPANAHEEVNSQKFPEVL